MQVARIITFLSAPDKGAIFFEKIAPKPLSKSDEALYYNSKK